MKFSSLFIFLFLVLAISCGKKVPAEGKRKVSISENQINSIINNQIVECASIEGQSCPEGIARLMIIDPLVAEESAVCSGFMIGPDRLVTNNHCVSTVAQCKNTYVLIYNGTSYEKSRCSEILETSIDYKSPGDPRKKIDVSVLRLNRRFSGKVFRDSLSRPMLGDQLTSWVIDHTGLDKENPNLFESRITEFSCQVGRKSLLQSLILSKCPAIQGNSGSPVVDLEGAIVGVLWGATAQKNVTTKTELFMRRSLDESAAVTEVEYFRKHFTP
jgi:V8-like Glu-specific endopeptidase